MGERVLNRKDLRTDRTLKELDDKYIAIFMIIERVGNIAYRLKALPESMRRTHVLPAEPC